MKKLNLLIVDDEDSIRISGRTILSDMKIQLPYLDDEYEFEIKTADSAEKALNIIKETPPDIIVLDHMLPGMSGTELLEKIENNEKSDPVVVMITGQADAELAISATAKGAFDFLSKPFTPRDLQASVYRAAKQRILRLKVLAMTEEKKKEKFEFVRVLAHELKSPLAAVEGYLHIIEGRMKGPELSSYDDMIERSAKRLEGMRRLIMDILDLTKIDAGEKKRYLEQVSVSEIVESCIESVKIMAREKSVEVNYSIPDKFSAKLDSGEFEMVLNNLLTNAVKYNVEGGKVFLVVRKLDNGISIRCEDTGIGMSTEDQEKLFKEFSRIKNKYTVNIPGSGLGLSILKKIIALYDGEVKVESAEGKGTVFNVFLSTVIDGVNNV
ncbi:MAG TPA: ATP-binding protein [bacterium]|nr:ATP-binding protein [bacterium]HPS29527.1 ATP-binding protein [bacterium]